MNVITSYAMAMKITPKLGAVVGITDLDADFDLGGVTYSARGGAVPTAFEQSAALNVDNLEIEGLLESAGITRAAIANGVYDYAGMEIFIYDWEAQTKVKTLARGSWGRSRLLKGAYVAEYRSLSQALQAPQGKKLSPTCRVNVGDTECGVDLIPLTVTGTVTSVDSSNPKKAFSDTSRTEADGYFAYGVLTWTSGANTGASMEVDTFAGFNFGLFTRMFENIQIGDTYSVYPGCDGKDSTCQDKFGNMKNFQGEDDIPGMDELTRFGGQS